MRMTNNRPLLARPPLTVYLAWCVTVSTAARYLRAYDETDALVIQNTGESQEWALDHLRKLATHANKLARELPAGEYPEASANTRACAGRLKELFPRFNNIL